jgi:hypothetical protein
MKMEIGLGSFQLGNFNLGNVVEGISDAMGLPEVVGDIASGAANYLSGNLPGLLEDGFDLAENLMTDPNAGKGSQPGRASVQANPVGAPLDPSPPAPTSSMANPLDKASSSEARKTGSMLDDLRNGIKPEGMTDADFAQFRMQYEMQEYQKMITMLTNIMKMIHDTNMAIVRNIAG